MTRQNNVIQECQGLTDAINDGSYREQHNKLFAARQALCWAINPESAASPYAVIMDSQEVRAGCQDEPCPPQS